MDTTIEKTAYRNVFRELEELCDAYRASVERLKITHPHTWQQILQDAIDSTDI